MLDPLTVQPPAFVAGHVGWPALSPTAARDSPSHPRPGRRHFMCAAASPGGGGGGDDIDDLAAARSALERAIAAEMPVPAERGDGSCDCIWCRGTGKYRCSWCRGQGVREGMTPEQMAEDMEAMRKGEPVPQREPQRAVCPACKGDCVLRCRYCKGFGKGIYGFSLAK